MWILGIAITQSEVGRPTRSYSKPLQSSEFSMWIFIIIETQIHMPFVIIFRSVISSLSDCLLAVQACAQFNHIWFIAHWFFNGNRCRWTLIWFMHYNSIVGLQLVGVPKIWRSLDAGDRWGLLSFGLLIKISIQSHRTSPELHHMLIIEHGKLQLSWYFIFPRLISTAFVVSEVIDETTSAQLGDLWKQLHKAGTGLDF